MCIGGGSREAGCVPGCFVPGHTRRCTFEEPNGCAWAPEDLRTMLETHAARVNAVNRYNEVVVDTKVVVDGLPHTIEAAFFMVDAVDGEKGYEKQRRATFKPFHTKEDGAANITGTVSGARASDARASEMGMEDMYGRQSNIQGGFYEMGGEDAGTMNPMADAGGNRPISSQFDQADMYGGSRDSGFVGSSHNPMLQEAEGNSQL